jgi:hypothetical protein
MPALAVGGDALLRENVAFRINFFDYEWGLIRDHQVGRIGLI